MELVTTQATIAGIVVFLMQFLKNRPWYQQLATALPMANKYVHRALGVLGALASGVGITWTFMAVDGGGWQGVINIPDTALMLSMAWTGLQNLLLQEVFYKKLAA